jgi:hypothetical protein
MIKVLLVFCFFSLVFSLQGQEARIPVETKQERVKTSSDQTIIRAFTPDDNRYRSYRKEVCPFTGKVIYSEVEYSSGEGRYVPATSGKCDGPDKEVRTGHQLSMAQRKSGAEFRASLSERD